MSKCLVQLSCITVLWCVAFFPLVSNAATPSKPGEVFRDCEACPQMVVLPAGRFDMGSPIGEKQVSNGGLWAAGGEGPQHSVEIRQFAIGRAEITVGEFRRFVEATGYKTDAERDEFKNSGERLGCMSKSEKGQPMWKMAAEFTWRNPGFTQDDTHPVACISWNDAQAYVKWLRETTKKNYRLPSEAEWEYATRAGTVTAYYWGARLGMNPSKPDCEYENLADKSAVAKGAYSTNGYDGSALVSNCEDGYGYTAPVAHFQANAFGLYDTLGNVAEWVEDCWHEDYSSGAPTDGSAWNAGQWEDGSAWRTKGDCGMRILRGNSWNGGGKYARSASRFKEMPDYRRSSNGFRVARTLD